MEINRLEGIIESILFTMGDSVELSKIALAIGQMRTPQEGSSIV